MDRITYFVDWRPVSCLPAHSPPVCSDVSIKQDIKGLLASVRVAAGSEAHSLTSDALRSVRYRWRDDGFVVFELTLHDSFVEAADEYYARTSEFHTSQEFRNFLSEKGNAERFTRIDRRARPEPDRNAPRKWKSAALHQISKSDFERTVLLRLAQTASDVVKRSTGHVHCFNSPNTRAGRAIIDTKRVSLDHIFLRIEPVPIDGSGCCTAAEIDGLRVPDPVKQALKEDQTPLTALLDDALLVRLMRKRRTGPDRPAVFHLRRGYAALVDECMRLLPFLKQQHFLGQLPWPLNWVARLFGAKEVTWPQSLVVTMVPLSMLVWLVILLIVDLTLGQWALAILATFASWLAIYVAVEFGERRKQILAAFQRTAGVLEYGAVLGAALNRVAAAADMPRGGQGTAMEDRAPAILQRRIELEHDKRDGNREMLALVTSVVAAFFTAFAAFGWETPIASLLKPGIDQEAAASGAGEEVSHSPPASPSPTTEGIPVSGPEARTGEIQNARRAGPLPGPP